MYCLHELPRYRTGFVISCGGAYHAAPGAVGGDGAGGEKISLAIFLKIVYFCKNSNRDAFRYKCV